MKKPLIITAACLVLLCAAAYGGYHFGFTRGAQSPQAPATGLKAGDIDPQTGKKILYWHDPMVPGQRFDKPGK